VIIIVVVVVVVVVIIIIIIIIITFFYMKCVQISVHQYTCKHADENNIQRNISYRCLVHVYLGQGMLLLLQTLLTDCLRRLHS